MDGRGLIGETFGDGAAIAAVVMNTVTGLVTGAAGGTGVQDGRVPSY